MRDGETAVRECRREVITSLLHSTQSVNSHPNLLLHLTFTIVDHLSPTFDNGECEVEKEIGMGVHRLS